MVTTSQPSIHTDERRKSDVALKTFFSHYRSVGPQYARTKGTAG